MVKQSNSALSLKKLDTTSTSSDGPQTSQAELPYKAQEEQLDELFPILLEFIQLGVYRDYDLDENVLYETLRHCINNGAVFTNGTGLIVGLIVPFPFKPDMLIAQELMWYAPKGGGARLRRAFERWAHENGAKKVQLSLMNTPHSMSASKQLVAAGYQALEVAYVKELV